MMNREEFIVLNDLTDSTVIISWGAFPIPFDSKVEVIGFASPPYGEAIVDIWSIKQKQTVSTKEANYVKISNLLPNTIYNYKLTINGKIWGDSKYRNTFQTYPKDEQNLNFAVIGDFGTGEIDQYIVASVLEKYIDNFRFILTTGDNIYATNSVGTGSHDIDWYLKFYKPYKYIINRVVVYPSIGNHDTEETEKSDDYNQIFDNFYLNQRNFNKKSLKHGLFYSFTFGPQIEFVAIDSSLRRFMNETKFLEETILLNPRKWVIPFFHHPPYCAGPFHGNNITLIRKLVPLFEKSKVTSVFCGHEHNFQYSYHDKIHYFISGAAGQLRRGFPYMQLLAHTKAWAAEHHFLLVTIDNNQMTVKVIGKYKELESFTLVVKAH